MTELVEKRCRPCEGGVPPLSRADAERYLKKLEPSWSFSPDGTALERLYRFPDFHRTMAFVNAVAWIAHQEDHHQDLEVGYNRLKIRYQTHAIGGLSENDFICAAKIDRLGAEG